MPFEEAIRLHLDRVGSGSNPTLTLF